MEMGLCGPMPLEEYSTTGIIYMEYSSCGIFHRDEDDLMKEYYNNGIYYGDGVVWPDAPGGIFHYWNMLL